MGMQRLLAFLALKGSTHRYVVAGTLWPEMPDAQALAALRTSIWRLNRALPDAICSEGMALSPSGSVSIDSRKQEEYSTRLLRDLVDDDRWLAAGLENLWPGELLPGWYEEWVVFERERLSQLRLHALERVAGVMTRAQRLEAALQLALEAVHTEPLRESATACLMKVYLAEGNVASAIHQYELFRDLLQRELDLKPSPALERILPNHARRRQHEAGR